MAAMKAIRVQNSTMDVYVGAPARQSRGPAIVLMYHRGGIDTFTKGVVDRLVGAGYVVAVPDVYHRCPSAMPIAERKSLMKDSEVVADVQATIDDLRARPDVAAD